MPGWCPGCACSPPGVNALPLQVLVSQLGLEPLQVDLPEGTGSATSSDGRAAISLSSIFSASDGGHGILEPASLSQKVTNAPIVAVVPLAEKPPHATI